MSRRYDEAETKLFLGDKSRGNEYERLPFLADLCPRRAAGADKGLPESVDGTAALIPRDRECKSKSKGESAETSPATVRTNRNNGTRVPFSQSQRLGTLLILCVSEGGRGYGYYVIFRYSGCTCLYASDVSHLKQRPA